METAATLAFRGIRESQLRASAGPKPPTSTNPRGHVPKPDPLRHERSSGPVRTSARNRDRKLFKSMGIAASHIKHRLGLRSRIMRHDAFAFLRGEERICMQACMHRLGFSYAATRTPDSSPRSKPNHPSSPTNYLTRCLHDRHEIN